MNTIKLKRGRHENLPVLAVGEPAFTTDTKELYIGTATGNVKISADIDEINTILVNYVTNTTFNLLENRVSNVETNKVSTSTLNQQLLLKQETKPNGVDSLVLGNKINPVYMDNLFVTDIFVVANQSAMLALNAQRGDFAIRTDIGKTFVLKQSPATTLANWVELQTTSDVVSVNGKTGAVTIEISDLDGLQAALNAKVDVTTYEDEQQAQDTLIANKVDKVAGKGLSTNDYTTTEKNKLSGIEAGAQVNPTASQIKTQYESNADTNAFTDDEKDKLSGIETGAEVNPYSKTQLDNMFDDKVDKNANITAGTHPKITYDAKGLVTGGAALAATDIPNLNASKINAGEFAADRIPNLNASKINAGVFNVARIPDLAATKITQSSSNRFVSDAEKTYWDGKQDKLTAGDNITIDEETNEISASGSDYELTKDKIEDALRGTNSYTIQLGKFSKASGHSGTALGRSATASGASSTAIGYNATAAGVNSIAIGKDTIVSEDNVVDFGSARQVRVNETPVDDRDAVSKAHLVTALAGKVDKVSGKGLSTNDYTNTDKQSVEKIPTIEQDILDLESDKVDKVAGKGLSTNDYTTAEKNKLAGISANAEQNRAIATTTQAQAGTNNTTVMTPLRVKEAIAVATIDGGEW